MTQEGPSGWTAVLAHPFEFATAILFALSAYGLGKAEVDNVQGLSLLRLPSPVVWAWVVCLALGAILVVAGLLRGPTTILGGTLEKAGLFLAMAAWTTLGISIASFNFSAWTGYAQIFVVALGCGLRLWALIRVERHLTRRRGDDS